MPSPQQEWEAQALALKHHGYNGGVVARRLIEEHGMAEEDAVALVSRLYGKKVNPRAGDTTFAVVRSLLMIGGAAGAMIVIAVVTQAAFGRMLVLIHLGLLGVIGTGAASLIKALINVGAKDALRR